MLTKGLGLDLLLIALNHFRHDTFFDWVRSVLNVPGHTVELRLLGTRLVMTDEADNIKALMSTQVWRTHVPIDKPLSLTLVC